MEFQGKIDLRKVSHEFDECIQENLPGHVISFGNITKITVSPVKITFTPDSKRVVLIHEMGGRTLTPPKRAIFFELSGKQAGLLHQPLEKEDVAIRLRPPLELRAGLDRLAITPETASGVVLSHTHLDHAGGLADFPNAQYIFFEEAFESVRGKQGWNAVKLGFLPDTEVEFRVKGNSVELVRAKDKGQLRGRKLISQMRGKATVSMSTDEIMALTRG